MTHPRVRTKVAGLSTTNVGRQRRALLLSVLLAMWGGAGCATIGEPADPLVPTRHRTQTGPYAVYSSFPISPESPAIRCLHSLQSDVATTLGIRVPAEEPPVEVYILNDRAAFTHFLKFYFPDLPSRRAFFMAHGQRRVVYTYLGDRLEEDLRHEASHALLNAAVGDLPLWLDEGLAEYFEVPSGRKGFNAEHSAKLPYDVASGWKPDLRRLETLANVQDMSPRDYRESWAWAQYLLNGSPEGKAALLRYIADLHQNPHASRLADRLPEGLKTAEATLLTQVEHLRPQPTLVKSPTAPTTTLRFQDPPQEPSTMTPPRRNFFTRLGSLLGL